KRLVPGGIMLVCVLELSMLFFFSSRRRHTRWPRDWSSDVCSSDLLARHYARVSAHATLVMPEPQTVSVCLDKLQVYRRVSDLGLALPKTDSAFDLAQLLELAKDIRFPCIVKPRTSLHPFFGQKAVLCRTEEALTSSFAVWPTRQEALIVQAW